MKILTAEFIKSCVDPKQFPAEDRPEITFVGRSNVGKSSLINSLLNRRDLAKVSRTPGKTRSVNIFGVATSDPALARFYLVDLPGYGFANVSRSVRAHWGPLIETYLTNRSVLAGVVLLVESRVVTDHDRQTLAWLHSIGRAPLIVATKVDKLRTGERAEALRGVSRALGLSEGELVIPHSSVTGEGNHHLWKALRTLIKT
ncbi:MAG: ribosome biogenesis GTP-binding protein YihA/YsxC [Nitrospira sp.]|nr:ribosome biogenesis GTP-binding protein YihA/YsxC [Nitrospira sp.]